jgi:hypothetical protein
MLHVVRTSRIVLVFLLVDWIYPVFYGFSGFAFRETDSPTDDLLTPFAVGIPGFILSGRKVDKK